MEVAISSGIAFCTNLVQPSEERLELVKILESLQIGRLNHTLWLPPATAFMRVVEETWEIVPLPIDGVTLRGSSKVRIDRFAVFIRAGRKWTFKGCKIGFLWRVLVECFFGNYDVSCSWLARLQLHNQCCVSPSACFLVRYFGRLGCRSLDRSP